MTYHKISYQDDRHAPRTAEEILCGDCVDAIRDGGAWAIHSEQIPMFEWPAMCPLCHVAWKREAKP